jgi:hypothetical protein
VRATWTCAFPMLIPRWEADAHNARSKVGKVRLDASRVEACSSIGFSHWAPLQVCKQRMGRLMGGGSIVCTTKQQSIKKTVGKELLAPLPWPDCKNHWRQAAQTPCGFVPKEWAGSKTVLAGRIAMELKLLGGDNALTDYRKFLVRTRLFSQSCCQCS